MSSFKMLPRHTGERLEKETLISESPLHAAETAKAVKEALEKGEKIDTLLLSIGTPLNKAISCRNLEVASCLIRHGADVNIPEYQGHTPLHNASVRGFEELVSLLIENGAGLNLSGHSGETPLIQA